MTPRTDIRIAVIGLGHWGPNHLRTFHQLEGAQVVASTDLDSVRRAHIKKLYPNLLVTDQAQELFLRSDIDAVIIATPLKTHYGLAKAALEAGKHILLEKPMCLSIQEAEQLVELSVKQKCVIMHGHVFVYHRGIQYLKKGLEKGDFGKVLYLHASRTNLGPIRYDTNVIRDLATHELSIFEYLFNAMPLWISASASHPLGTKREDVAFIALEYPGNVLAHVHVSWLHPQKIRTLTLVGDKKMVVWDDMNPFEPIRIFDKGVVEEP